MRRALALGAVVVALGLALARAFPPSLLEDVPFSQEVVDAQGRLLRLTLAADGAYRVFTPLDEVAPAVVEGTLLYEDRWFFWHPGVNPVALVKAFLSTHVTGEGRRGASTLTMQLARLKGRLHTRTWAGKAWQVLAALHLEWCHSKRALLEAYLNLAPYGGNLSGVGAASRVYFQREVKALAVPEALALAVLPQRPGRRLPQEGVEPASLRAARQRLSLEVLKAHPRLARDSLALDESLRFSGFAQLPFLAPHAVTRALAEEREGPRRLRLTVDGRLQALVERLVARHVDRRRDEGLDNAAVLVLEAGSGAVRAYVGSAGFFDEALQGQVDGVTARRSPGSALKPVVYARALDEGLIHPLTLLKDVPMRFGAYNPENIDSDYLGPLSAREALARSRNVPAVELNLGLGRGLYDVLREVGTPGLKDRDFYGAGIVLGAVEVSLEELASLYGALARGGTVVPARLVEDGRAAVVKAPLASPEASALTLAMLSSPLALLDAWATPGGPRAVAWKTGTSSSSRDAWTVGVAGPHVVAVWVGHFDGKPNPALVGRTAAAPLFFEVVEALGGQGDVGDVAPVVTLARLGEARLCPVSGKLAGASCPHAVRGSIIPGVSPIAPCDVHRTFHVEVASGKARCAAVPGVTREEVYEVWPSDVRAAFARAGLSRRPLPPGAEDCPGDVVQGQHPPRILSPQPDVLYQVRPAHPHIPLLAHPDGEARALTWFAGAELLGTSRPGAPLDWAPRPGRHEVRVVDDRGNTARVVVRVARSE